MTMKWRSRRLVEPEVEDLDDVGVHEPRGGERLAAEARHELRVLGEVLGQQLHRDVALQPACRTRAGPSTCRRRRGGARAGSGRRTARRRPSLAVPVSGRGHAAAVARRPGSRRCGTVRRLGSGVSVGVAVGVGVAVSVGVGVSVAVAVAVGVAVGCLLGLLAVAVEPALDPVQPLVQVRLEVVVDPSRQLGDLRPGRRRPPRRPRRSCRRRRRRRPVDGGDQSRRRRLRDQARVLSCPQPRPAGAASTASARGRMTRRRMRASQASGPAQLTDRTGGARRASRAAGGADRGRAPADVVLRAPPGRRSSASVSSSSQAARGSPSRGWPARPGLSSHSPLAEVDLVALPARRAGRGLALAAVEGQRHVRVADQRHAVVGGVEAQLGGKRGEDVLPDRVARGRVEEADALAAAGAARARAGTRASPA